MKPSPSSLTLIISSIFFLPSCKPHPDQQKPNILFIMSDDHAIQAISAYGSGLNATPNIDEIGKKGIIYNKAFVTNSICAPSRAVILTGKYSHINGVPGNGQIFDGSQQTLPKILQENGYETAVIGKWHLKSDPTGFDYWNILPGQGDYYNPDFIKLGKDTLYNGYVTEIITRLSLEWLQKRDRNKPFFLMMHHKAPHRNWMPALKNLELYDNQDFPLPDNFFDNYEGREALKVQKLTIRDHMDIRMDFKVPCIECDTVKVNSWAPGEYWRSLDRLNKDERKEWEQAYKKEEEEFRTVKDDPAMFARWKFRRYMEDYLRTIASVDESVEDVLEFLRENKLDENTLVIYTSDQGFFLGEHGLFDKRFMYEEALRTPLLMRFAGKIKQGVESDHLVLNLDIAPTLLMVAGVNIPDDMQGKALQATWTNSAENWREAIYYHYYEKSFGATPHYGVRTTRYKLIHFYDVVDSWELYDLKEDPGEMNNMYYDQHYKEVVAELKLKLEELKVKYKDN